MNIKQNKQTHRSQILYVIRILMCLNLLFFSPYALSAEETAQPLFSVSEQDIPEVVLPSRAERSIVRDSRFVSIDTDILGGAQNTYSAPAQRILLNLLNNEVLVARLNRIENVSVGGYNWIGEIEGIELSQAIFSVKNGVVAGKIIIPGKIYEIRYITNDLYALQEINQSAFPPEAEPIAPPFLSNESTDSGAVEVAADSCTDITVLVPYSTEAKNAAGGASQIESVINLAVAETNQSYVNSGLTQRLTLVHTMETNEAANDFSTDLTALSNTSDGIFDDVDVARDAYYADLVGIIIENSSSCGLGYVNSSASYAFSVTHRTCATGYFSFGHELGHNMGARHDWYIDDSTGSPVAYSKGFVNVTDSWRTIMGYNTLCSDQGAYCQRLQYWSNPDVNYSGDSMGVISTGPTNCAKLNTSPDPSSCAADNRIRLNNTCSAVANFRGSPAVPVVSNSDPADGATVTEGGSGQLLRVTASGATSGTIYYDDDSGISNSTPATVNGNYLEATIPYASGSMNNDGTNYWYVEATNTAGTTRYPSSGNLSFTVTLAPIPPTVSNPDPADGSTVTEGGSGQLLRVTASGATSGTIYYDDDSGISNSTPATVNGNYLEATIPYASGSMNNDGTNYWYVEATNTAGTTRYPSSGNLSFTVTLAPIPPTVSNPDPADGSTVTEGGSGQLLRVTASGATSGTIYYDDDSGISNSTPATVNGNYLEATIPYASGSMNNDGTNYWYVEATNTAGTTRYPSSGNLSFTVTLAPTLDQYEPDNDSGQANIIQSSSSQVHSIVPSDDEDWVMFTLTEISDLTVETNGASGDTRMWLYDGSLTEIAFDDDGGNGFFSKITMSDLAAGTYYVEIDEHWNNDEIPSYTIIASYLSSQDEDILLMILPAIISAIKQK